MCSFLSLKGNTFKKDSLGLKGDDSILVVLKDTSLLRINPRLRYSHALLFPNAKTILFDTSYTSEGNEVFDIIPIYENEIIKRRLTKIKSTIPLQFNNKTKRWIDVYTNEKRYKAKEILGRTPYYFPFIEYHLKKAGIPEELKYITVIESAMNPYAVSRSGAMGLWQFTRNTAAKHLNMSITPIYDDRRDHYESTKNAIKYFKELYGIFDDWLLAIAAYNGGPGTVKKAIRKAGGGKKTFWAIAKYLPSETRNYVPAFIAVIYLNQYAKEHYITPIYPDGYHSFLHPKNTRKVRLSGPLSFSTISKHLGISMQKMVFLNPDYNIPYLPKGKYSIALPREKALVAHVENNTMLKVEMKNPTKVGMSFVHKIKSGESIGLLAKKYKCSISELKAWNGITNNTVIFPGNTLIIFNTSSYSNSYHKKYQLTKRGTYVEKGGFVFYTIKRGDTLFKIAKKFNVNSIDNIRRTNKIYNDRSLMPGAVLKIEKNS